MRTKLDLLQEVFRDVFEDDELLISQSTSAENVPLWDSLMHVTLILQVEKTYGVRFTSSQVSALKNVGELLDLIETLKNRR